MSSFKIWVTHPLDRVRPGRRAEDTVNYSLYAAKNEYESFQIVIHSGAEPLTVKNIIISDFVNKNNEKAETEVTVYREHYVEFVKNSKRSGMICQELPGLIPDALIPACHPKTGEPLGSSARFYAFPHEMAENEIQPYFIDVHIPATAKSGKFKASYTVVCDKGDFSGEISLNIWNITLPREQVQKSMFGSWTKVSADKAEEAAKNRMFIKTVDKEHQEYLHEKYGYNTCNIGFWSGADIETRKMRTPPTVEDVKEKLKTVSDKLERFSYSADEIGACKELFIPLIEWGQIMHKAGTKHLVVMPPKKELFDDGLGTGRSVVDIWVVLPKQYEFYKKNIDLAVKKGDSFWTYNCLVQDNYSPKYLLDYSLLGHRLHPGFINYSIKAQGFLFWVVDLYEKLPDPWTRLNGDGEEVWNGDGKLFYPSEDVGIEGSFVPSLRAKAIRDGFEDYELCHEIARLGKAAMSELYSNQIASDFRNYTEDPLELISNRKLLGEAFMIGDKDYEDG